MKSLPSIVVLLALTTACDNVPEPTPSKTASPSADGRTVVQGDPKGCFKRARDLTAANAADPKIAPELRCACDGDVAMACTHLAVFYREGSNGMPRDLARSTALYERGCELGDGWGCSDWGVALSKGRGVKRDLAASHRAAKRACRLDSVKGCSNAGMHLMNGHAGRQDFAQAAELLGKGCRLNDRFSCKMLEVARNPDGFRRDWRAQCSAGSTKSCLNLALLLAPGTEERATLLRDTCAAGITKACERLRDEAKPSSGR